MHRRTLLATVVAPAFGLGGAGCLSSVTGGRTAEFSPAVEAYNRGLVSFDEAQSVRTTARDRYRAEAWDDAATGYVAARDGFDETADAFDSAREATSGSCPNVHDRSQKQYRRSLALVEACDQWAAAATTRLAGERAARSEERAAVWDGRAAEYPQGSRLDPDEFSCRV